MRPYQSQVERGMAALDKADPEWLKTISLPKLAMDTCHRCIIGQWAMKHSHSWPTFQGGITVLARMAEEDHIFFCPEDFGFDVRKMDNTFDGGWEELQKEWELQIQERLDKNAASIQA